MNKPTMYYERIIAAFWAVVKANCFWLRNPLNYIVQIETIWHRWNTGEVSEEIESVSVLNGRGETVRVYYGDPLFLIEVKDHE